MNGLSAAEMRLDIFGAASARLVKLYMPDTMFFTGGKHLEQLLVDKRMTSPVPIMLKIGIRMG
jgi:hypothetical protein